MTEIEANRECLSRIVGEPLTAVMFVMDYLKLQFEESVLTILTSILVRTGDKSYQLGDMTWRDSLCDRITHIVSDLSLAEDRLQISFDDGSNFLIALKDEARAGNEALLFEYHEAPGPWQMLVMHIV